MTRTTAQIEASRRNGAQSKGPATPEGKARSAAARLTHGLNSDRVVVLNNESPDAFDQSLADAIAQYQPETPLERALVHDMVVSTWRLNRLLVLETACIDEETDRQRNPEGWNAGPVDESTRTHRAIAALTPNTLTWYSRHEARLRRSIRDARAQLRILQAARSKPAA